MMKENSSKEETTAMKKLALLASALAAAMLLTVNAAAEEDVESAQPETEPAVATITEVGLRRLPVTSALAEGAETGNLSALFDGKADTKIDVDLTEAEEKVFTLNTSSGVPQTLAAFGILTDGAPGTLVTLQVYGSNDSLLKEWTPLPLIQSVGEQNGFKVFHIEKTVQDWADAESYVFYRFVFTVDAGDGSGNGIGFTLSEVVLLRPDSDEPDLVYAVVESVEPGEFPPLVPVKIPVPETEETAEETTAAEEPAVEEAPAKTAPSWNNITERPRFGLFGLGIFRGC